MRWMQNSARRPPTFGPSQQSWDIGPAIGSYETTLPNIITQLESRYSFYHLTEGRGLVLMTWCRMYWDFMSVNVSWFGWTPRTMWIWSRDTACSMIGYWHDTVTSLSTVMLCIHSTWYILQRKCLSKWNSPPPQEYDFTPFSPLYQPWAVSTQILRCIVIIWKLCIETKGMKSRLSFETVNK